MQVTSDQLLELLGANQKQMEDEAQVCNTRERTWITYLGHHVKTKPKIQRNEPCHAKNSQAAGR